MATQITARVLFVCAAVTAGAGLLSSGPNRDQRQDLTLVSRTALRSDKETQVLGQPGGALLNPIECDSKGRLYFRYYTAVRPYLAPVVRTSMDGQRTVTFSLSSVPGWEQGEIYDFAIAPGNDVYLLAARQAGPRIEAGIISFDEDGGFGHATPLKQFSAEHLAVFSTGEFLVSGWSETKDRPTKAASSENSSKDSEEIIKEGKAYTIIVNRMGDVVKEVKLSPPSSGKGAPKGGASPSGPAEKDNDYWAPTATISLASVAAGDDGRVYYVMPASPPLIYAIDASGNVADKLQLTPPSDKAIPVSLRFASGRGLIVQYAEKHDDDVHSRTTAFALVNAQTGETIRIYDSPSDVGGAFVCYANEVFTFLGNNDKGKLVIRTATPH